MVWDQAGQKLQTTWVGGFNNSKSFQGLEFLRQQHSWKSRLLPEKSNTMLWYFLLSSTISYHWISCSTLKFRSPHSSSGPFSNISKLLKCFSSFPSKYSHWEMWLEKSCRSPGNLAISNRISSSNSDCEFFSIAATSKGRLTLGCPAIPA